jgi:hypothetical protein
MHSYLGIEAGWLGKVDLLLRNAQEISTIFLSAKLIIQVIKLDIVVFTDTKIHPLFSAHGEVT